MWSSVLYTVLCPHYVRAAMLHAVPKPKAVLCSGIESMIVLVNLVRAVASAR